MWHNFSKHHVQRGAATAVVWGSPGGYMCAENDAAGSPRRGTHKDAGAVQTATGFRPSEVDTANADADTDADDGAEAGSRGTSLKVNAEELTRGRRAETPFVQQCDLIFPLPLSASDVRNSYKAMEDDDTDGRGQARLEQHHAEVKKRAEEFVRKQLGEQSFYYRARGSLSALLTQPFLGACVLENNFCALSLNAPSDQGNCWAILPGGILVLSLDRETFQTLGLPGEAVRMRPKGNTKRAGAGAGCTGGGAGVSGGGAGGADRYVSVFDLSSKAFRPGKPLHDRLLSCLAGIGFRSGGSEQQAGIGETATVVPAVEVDMILCRWGTDSSEGEAAGERQQGAAGENGVCAGVEGGGGVKYECSQQQAQSASGGEGGGGGGKSRVKSEVAGGGVAGSKTGSRESHGKEGKGDGVPGEGQQQRQSKHGEEEEEVQFGCREVTFPQGLFSVTKKMILEPEVRVFHEACCPDLDWVGQGFIPPPPRPPRPPGPSIRAASLSQTDSFRSQPLPDERPPASSKIATATVPKARSTAVVTATAVDEAAQGRGSGDGPTAVGEAAAAAARATKCLLMLDLFEWLGVVSCGLDAQLRRSPSPPEPYLSSFETPQHLQYRQPAVVAAAGRGGVSPGSGGGGGQAASSRAVCRVRLRGLVPPPAVRRLVETAGVVAGGDMAACCGGNHERRDGERGQGQWGRQDGEGNWGKGLGNQPENKRETNSNDRNSQHRAKIDGCAWAAVTAWPFRDSPRAYAAADAPCGGGERGKKKNKRSSSDPRNGARGGSHRGELLRRTAREWPAGGHGMYTVVACPGETAAAFVSARCPGPGW